MKQLKRYVSKFKQRIIQSSFRKNLKSTLDKIKQSKFSQKCSFYLEKFKATQFGSKVMEGIHFLEKIYQKIAKKSRKHSKKFIHDYWDFVSTDTFNANSPPIQRDVSFGLIIVFVFFGGFMLWSLLFKIDSASVATGKIILEFSHKTIQHLEGGIINEILVKEGQIVTKGQPLIILRDVQPKAQFTALHDELVQLLADEARLVAERDEKPSIAFPALLIEEQNIPQVRKILNSTEQVFINNQQTFAGKIEIYKQRIDQIRKQIESYEALIQSYDTQIKWTEHELDAVKELDKKGMVEKTRLWALYRENARLRGSQGETLGKIAEAKMKIGETEQEILTLKDTELQKKLEDLTKTQTKIAELKEKEKASADVLDRTVIKSPANGIVLNLAEHTIGGVITPGKPIMEIVPQNDILLVEAQVHPEDIDVVHVGLKARVRLSIFKQRTTPTVDGFVTYVSADAIIDKENKNTYYIARIKVPSENIEKIKNVHLFLGMPVQVMIITNQLTPFNYFMGPLLDSFSHAFKEN